MQTHDNSAIVIAGKDVRDYLLSISSRGMTENEITLHYSDKYAGMVEYLLRMMRKSFGWEEKERGKTETMNLRCIYDESELAECKTCGHKKTIKKCKCPENTVPGGCQEAIRISCKYYKKKYNNLLSVNYVIIEKLPQIRT